MGPYQMLIEQCSPLQVPGPSPLMGQIQGHPHLGKIRAWGVNHCEKQAF